MTASIYMNAWNIEKYSRQGELKDSEYVLYFDYNRENSLENGTAVMQLQGLFGESFQDTLRQLPGVEKVTKYQGVDISFRWNGIEGNDSFTPIERENAEGLQQYLQEGIGDYDALVESGGVYINASGLWKEVYGKVPQVGDEIEFSYYNGESCSVRLPVVGIGTNKVYEMYTASGLFLIPRETANELLGDMDTTKMLTVSMKSNSHTPEQDEQMRTFLEGYPQLQLITLNEQMENAEGTYNITKGLLFSIGGFIILFSLVNLLNTLLSGLIARRQQLAMLAALGMTKRQIKKMLNYENLFLSGVNLMVTLILGTLAGWGVCQLMEKIGADYVKFSFPILWFLLYAVIAVGVPRLITRICLKSFYQESLIERLRITD